MEKAYSFAIPAYGESPWLPVCIESLLSQTVPGKIILCTGTPNTYIEETAEKYSLPLFINPDHRSIAGDWNFALSKCETRYCTLAHQDDVYYPAYAESLLPLMEDALIGFTDYEEILEDTLRPVTAMMHIKRFLLTPAKNRKKLMTSAAKKSILRFGSAICCPSVMFDLEKLRDFRFDEGYKVNLDWDAWLRMAEMDGGFAFRSEILMAHRIHHESETSRQIANAGRATEDAKMMKRLWPAPIAGILSRFYAHSTDFNKTKGDR